MTRVPQADPVEEGRLVVEEAEAAGAEVRLLGGAAVQLRAGAGVAPALRRTPADIDLVGAAGCGPVLAAVLAARSYRADEAFNQLEGYRRLLFYDDVNGRQLDVFVRDFSMCHTIPIGNRLTLEPLTLPLAELLLTKLQIVELNEKDRRDLYALLAMHAVGDDDGAAINGRHVGGLCGRDWGLHRTATLNIARLGEALGTLDVEGDTRARIAARIDGLASAIDAAPKTRGWRLRARLGDRLRWYQEPEEVFAAR